MVKEFLGLSYDQRLSSTNWSTLQKRHLCGAIIEVFKLLNGFDIAASNTLFNRSFSGLQGHELKLNQENLLQKFGYIFVFGIGIKYSQNVVSSYTVKTFKNK